MVKAQFDGAGNILGVSVEGESGAHAADQAAEFFDRYDEHLARLTAEATPPEDEGAR